MTDDGVGVILVFLQKIIGARESYLVDILVNLGCGHTDTAVAHRDGILAHGHMNRQVTHLTFEIAL